MTRSETNHLVSYRHSSVSVSIICWRYCSYR